MDTSTVLGITFLAIPVLGIVGWMAATDLAACVFTFALTGAVILCCLLGTSFLGLGPLW